MFVNREKQDELLDHAARMIVDNDLSEIAKAVLRANRITSNYFGTMGYVMGLPMIEGLAFFRPEFHDLGNIMIDNPREHLDKLIAKIEKFEQEKKEKTYLEWKAREESGTIPEPRKGVLAQIRSFFRH